MSVQVIDHDALVWQAQAQIDIGALIARYLDEHPPPDEAADQHRYLTVAQDLRAAGEADLAALGGGSADEKGTTADDAAWLSLADAAERALNMPGLSEDCEAKMIRVMSAGDRAAGRSPRPLPR